MFRAVVAGLCLATPLAAQEPAQVPLRQGVVQQLPVVVLDRDALFSQSGFGRRVRADIEAASTRLAAENRRIEAMLEAEERALTERRVTEEADAFRELAEEFDARVEGIRQAQDAKARAIQNETERAQQLFLERTGPILGALAREVGALVILDRRMVIASSDQVDITDLALTRIDAVLGDGDAPPPGAPAAESSDAPADPPDIPDDGPAVAPDR